MGYGLYGRRSRSVFRYAPPATGAPSAVAVAATGFLRADSSVAWRRVVFRGKPTAAGSTDRVFRQSAPDEGEG